MLPTDYSTFIYFLEVRSQFPSLCQSCHLSANDLIFYASILVSNLVAEVQFISINMLQGSYI